MMKTEKRTIVLGISCFYHDAAAALLVDGVIVSAAQEERFTRIKHDEDFPRKAVAFCLSSQGLTIDDVTHVVFYDKPILKFERILTSSIKVWPKGIRMFVMAMRVWLKKKLWIDNTIRKELHYSGDIFFAAHHYAHAASAYYCSPFSESTIVTMDGVGEWDTTTIGYARDNEIRLAKSLRFPHSLGLLYSAVTYFLGFKVNSAEYKVMGLAPYGNPEVYIEKMRRLVSVRKDGSFELNMKYFTFEFGATMTGSAFERHFGIPTRRAEDELKQEHKDIAAALQKVVEEVVLAIVTYAKREHPSDNLCLAGGVALNCVANGKILEKGIFKNIYIQPASGDAGGAVGAACYVYFEMLKNRKRDDVMPHVFKGPEFSGDDIDKLLKGVSAAMGTKISHVFVPVEKLADYGASLIAQNYVVGWFQGRMEFGPRALGNRSILADARNAENWQRVNLKIKFRESFRPFAPSVLCSEAGRYFDLRGADSPYMLLVARVKNDGIPAVTHIDRTARIQTVAKNDNALYEELIRSFFERTGCPVIINTSFNVRGEPIVCTPEDAFRTFIHTDMDYVILGNYAISKQGNPRLAQFRNTEAYLETFTLD